MKASVLNWQYPLLGKEAALCTKSQKKTHHTACNTGEVTTLRVIC